MPILITNREYYTHLKKNVFLYFKKDEEQYVDKNGNVITKIVWKNVDNNQQFKINLESIDFTLFHNLSQHILFIVGNEVQVNSHHPDSVSFYVYPMNLKNDQNSWIYLFNSFILRRDNDYDKYPFIYLIWSLNFCNWNEQLATSSIKRYNGKTIPYILEVLESIAKCLSINVQLKIRNVLRAFDLEYKLHAPKTLLGALKNTNESKNNLYDSNLFSLIQYYFYNSTQLSDIDIKIVDDSENPVILINKWLECEDASLDYNLVPPIFPLLNSRLQHQIIKRYFHDIRKGQTAFNEILIKQFKESTENEYARYRYCIFQPNEPYSISVPLLCDCLLTFKLTKGKLYQTLNGVLDLAIKCCDLQSPKIELNLERFLPECHGGAVYNSDFCGFVNLKIGYRLKPVWNSQKIVQGAIHGLIASCGRPKVYYACSVDSSPLSLEQLHHCNHKNLRCSVQIRNEHLWIVDNKYKDLFNSLVNESLTSSGTSCFEISKEQITEGMFVDWVESFLKKHYTPQNGVYYLNPGFEEQLFIQYFFEPKTLRIIPKKNITIGHAINLFNLETDSKNHTENELKAIQEEEKKIIYERVVTSLENLLNTVSRPEGCFEVPYSSQVYNEVKSLYYCHTSVFYGNNNEDSFLSRRSRNYHFFCAPKVADRHNQALDLSYVWCHGKECFQTALSKHTLANNHNWKEYSLLHFSEILGYSKVIPKDGQYETDPMVSGFISMCNKVLRTFSRLQCRSCKHLIFPDKGTDYNKFNHFSCVNPVCKEYQKVIYLNYCFTCKKGLIDSRDSIRCPNGWFICPICHACCDDAQYERQAQRYVLSHRPIPDRIREKLGHGHNDKGIYFCHICGTQLEKRTGEHDEETLYCPKCDKYYK